MKLKYVPSGKRTEFDEDGNPKIEFEYDEMGRPLPLIKKKYFWEF